MTSLRQEHGEAILRRCVLAAMMEPTLVDGSLDADRVLQQVIDGMRNSLRKAISTSFGARAFMQRHATCRHTSGIAFTP